MLCTYKHLVINVNTTFELHKVSNLQYLVIDCHRLFLKDLNSYGTSPLIFHHISLPAHPLQQSFAPSVAILQSAFSLCLLLITLPRKTLLMSNSIS